ncbi:MAG: phosphatidate phosphatase App1 family protein [Pirellulales bacterium]
MQLDETAVSNLNEDESVVVYPTMAHLAPDGKHWLLNIHGCVYETVPHNFSRKFLLQLLGRIMQATPEDLESEIFKKHIHGFVVHQHGGKRIAVRIGDNIYRLKKKTKKNGQFNGKIKIPADETERLLRQSEDGKSVHFSVVAPAHQTQVIRGNVQSIQSEGISIISDIDDTVKHTDVSSKRAMLNNTFLKEFQTVPGIVELYQQWQQQGADFHYVTSSPWQLYDSIANLFQQSGIPQGSFHMKSVRFRDPTILRLFIARRLGKRRTIKQIIKTFPKRKFILVGDSGEKDPETYGAMARRFPDQIDRIYIRNLQGKNSTASRYEKAFRKIPSDVCQIFEKPEELSISLPSALNP